MKHRLSGMNQNDIENIANDPSAMVMQPTYDHIFEPWEANRIRRAVNKIINISESAENKDEVDEVVAKDQELVEFSKLHNIIYTKISNPEIAKKREIVEVLNFMIATQESLRKGELREVDARAKVSDKALFTVNNMK